MTAKEGLIKAIEGSSDEVVISLLKLLRSMQAQDQIKETYPRKTVLERMGGIPNCLLENGQLSDRDKRRAYIKNYLRSKNQECDENAN